MVEIRLGLVHLLWNFEMRLSEQTGGDWLEQKGWMTWDKKPLFVKLKVREHQVLGEEGVPCARAISTG